MPSTQHAYDHVAGIFLPVAIAVFAAVVIALGRAARARRAPAQPGPAQRGQPSRGRLRGLLGATVGVLVWVTFTAETPIDRLVGATRRCG